MSFSDSKNSRKDFVWKYVIEVSEEQYLRCKFCNQRWAGGVNRLKHHLAGTHHGMKSCPKVSEDVRLECKDAFVDPHLSRASPLNGETRFLCVEKPLNKRFGVATYFCFILKGKNKIRKKNPKYDS